LWFFVLEDLWNSKQLQWRFIVTKLKFLIVTYSNYKSLANMYWLSWIKKKSPTPSRSEPQQSNLWWVR
jgi:hypothetical protein